MLELPLLSALRKVYPQLDNYKEAISANWENTQQCYESVSLFKNGPGQFMEAVHKFLDATEVMLLQVEKLAKWMEEYSYEQNNSIQVIIYFLTAGILAISGLLMSLTRDVARRKKIAEKMRIVAARTINAQEKERERISLELHDSVAQDLSAVMISLGMQKESEEKNPDVAESIKRIIGNVRAISYDLRPPDFEAIGFSRAASKYCAEFSQSSGIAVDFLATGMNAIELGREVENNLYRILQESLTNVKKHAHAGKVVVRLTYSNPFVVMMVEDDGKSFDEAEVRTKAINEKRMGIQGMRERVSILKGSMSIGPAKGKGTRIAIRIPVKKGN